MTNWHVALLTLAALLAGLLIPVLWQLRSTLRELQRKVRDTSARMTVVLDDAAVVTARVRRVTDSVDGREEELGALFTSAADLSQTIDNLRSKVSLAAAVTAAAVAGYRVYREVQAVRAEGAGEPAEPVADPAQAEPVAAPPPPAPPPAERPEAAPPERSSSLRAEGARSDPQEQPGTN